MDRDLKGELEGLRSINDLLDDPVGTVPFQMILPFPA